MNEERRTKNKRRGERTLLWHVVGYANLAVLDVALLLHVHVVADHRAVDNASAQQRHHTAVVKEKPWGPGWAEASYPAEMVTWFMMTELMIFTPSWITQCLPMTDFLIDARSPTRVPSPTTHSAPTWYKRQITLRKRFVWQRRAGQKRRYLCLGANDCGGVDVRILGHGFQWRVASASAGDLCDEKEQERQAARNDHAKMGGAAVGTSRFI